MRQSKSRMNAPDHNLTGGATADAVAVRCKKCGGKMRETSGADFRAWECLQCQFVMIEPVTAAGGPAADGRQQ